MNKVEWEGILDEGDLWKLFSDHPDKPSETILFFSEIKPLLKKMRFMDEARRYQVYSHGTGYPDRPEDARYRATVTQRNLRAVATAIAGRGNNDAAIQYLGRSEADPARPTPTPEIVQQPKKALTAHEALPDVKKFAKDDTLDKIVTSYFATLTAEPFSYGGKEYLPRDVHVSPGILRGYTCPAMCGGCCPRFSLDYIAPDGVPSGTRHPLTRRVVEFNGREVEVWSDMQRDHSNPKCRNLNLDDGRCGIHGFQPFSCDFELLRSIIQEKSPRADFTQKLYGRGWAMMRIDGERGALCKMTPPTTEARADVDRRLARLETWMTHFGLNPKRVSYIRQHLDQIAETGKPLVITGETEAP
jgi:hypothetical protein